MALALYLRGILGSAIGFRLDSLLKLTETRAINSRMTLMHYHYIENVFKQKTFTRLVLFLGQLTKSADIVALCVQIEVESLANLAELPEFTAILVLDQFMLSGADEHEKGTYLASLISKKRNCRG